MNFTRMEYFLAAAEKLNFTAAAKSLYVSQPALSKQISLLEEELDTRLFVRDRRNIALTKAGKQLQMDLTAIFEEIEEAKYRAWKIGHEQEDTIRIGCFDGAYTDDFLPKVVSRIAEVAPKINMDIQRGNFKRMREALQNKEVDILFTLSFELPELFSFQNKVICQRRSGLIYSNKSPLAQIEDLSLEDFEKETFLVMDPDNSPGGNRKSMQGLKSIPLNPDKILYMKDMETLMTYLELGKGFSLLESNVGRSRNSLRFFDVETLKAPSVVAVWEEDTPLIKAILEVFEA